MFGLLLIYFHCLSIFRWAQKAVVIAAPDSLLSPHRRAYLEGLLRTSDGLADWLGHSGHCASARMMEFCSRMLEDELGDHAESEPPSSSSTDTLPLQLASHGDMPVMTKDSISSSSSGLPNLHRELRLSILLDLPQAHELNLSAGAAAQPSAGNGVIHGLCKGSGTVPASSHVMSHGPILMQTSSSEAAGAAPVPFASIWVGTEDYHGVMTIWALWVVALTFALWLYPIVWLGSSELL